MPKPVTTPTQRFLIGATGGLVPVLLNLVAVKASTLFSDTTPAEAAGYVVQAIALASLGGLVAWLRDRAVLAQLGIAAPSFFKGVLSAGGAFTMSVQLWLVTPLLAAQPTQQYEVPRATVTQQFVSGFLGVTVDLPAYLVEVHDDDDRAGALRKRP